MIFVDRYGQSRHGKIYVCQECGIEFIDRVNPAQKTQPKYCSQVCGYKARTRNVTISCTNCGCDFDAKPSRVNSVKHGKLFCSRACKEYAQSFKGTCAEIRPDHYDAENPSDYRKTAYQSLPHCCANCEEKSDWMLIVHHIDGNRKNNDIANLEILCHNHHAMRHLRWTGRCWIYSPQHLTPLEKLESLILKLEIE